MERVVVLLSVLFMSCAALDLKHAFMSHGKEKTEQWAFQDASLLSVVQMHRDILEAQKADLPNIPGVVGQLGLSTLLQLVVKAKLDSVLSSPGPFTVFGPTNKAFEVLPEWAKKWVDMNDTVLADVLKYHVLAGEVASKQIENEATVTTVLGKSLRFNKYDNGVVTAQCSPIDLKQVDEKASNGLVHVLNRVMLPPYGNLVESVAACPAFKTLVTAVKAAGLAGALSGPGPFTLFAPTDAAFSKLPPGTLEDLLKNPTKLAAVLEYHVVKLTYCSAGLTSTKLTTLNGQDVAIKVADGSVTVNGAKVIAADASVTNGVVHAIDTVLLPS